ncbi:thiamine-monophosphate kinase [Actinomadura madurae]|uniref:Thiamine-monophosphate kinase n=1 Tax=Actinomadura madurae TaxID=1993 RepID=A0A1I5MEF7_9ACTN|nr:hypothetical protein [Actinomadura madurae]SFP07316.1 thiamine-monophosphate kinase [Actinomadura madurae]
MVEESALPVAGIVAEVARLTDGDLTSVILGDSVDFQLVFTVAADDVPRLSKVFADAGLQFSDIGHATEERQVRLRGADGREQELPGVPWRHAT